MRGQRIGYSPADLHGLRKRKGWKTGREGDRYKGRHRRFNAVEMAWLKANHELPIAEYHASFVAAFPRDDVRPQNLHALRKRMGWKTGRTGQFEKGVVSHNKGVKCAPGTGGRHPNAQRTQFRAGALPHNTKGAGHERIDSKDGYVVIIVDEPNPWTGAATRPVHKHRWLWEKLHGPIPEGMALKCLDGNKINTDPSNWELIPRALLPRLNGGRGNHGSGKARARNPRETARGVMGIRTFQIPGGARVIIRACEGCGSPNAPYGTGRYTDALNSRDPSKVKCWCGPDGCQAIGSVCDLAQVDNSTPDQGLGTKSVG